MLSTILALLPKVGPVVAALPEFRRLIEDIAASFDDNRDQAALQQAYELALSDADDAHARLQELVAQRTR